MKNGYLLPQGNRYALFLEDIIMGRIPKSLFADKQGQLDFGLKISTKKSEIKQDILNGEKDDDESIKTVGYVAPKSDVKKQSIVMCDEMKIQTSIEVVERSRCHKQFYVVRVERTYANGDISKEPEHWWPSIDQATQDYSDMVEIANDPSW